MNSKNQDAPQKKWLSIETPEGFSYWEYQDGNYSATIFESHQPGVEKKEASVYFKGELLDANVFFLSKTGPRKAAERFIANHREESKPKKAPSIFEQARRAISYAKNRKESEDAAKLFHGLTNSGKITREEESILEAFLVLKVAEFIKEPEVSTSLPGGCNSWFSLWASGCHSSDGEKEITFASTCETACTNTFPEIVSYRYNADFVKARALEEIADFLPNDTEEVSRMAYGTRHEMRMGNKPQGESPIEKKLFAMLRFYGKNDIRRN